MMPPAVPARLSHASPLNFRSARLSPMISYHHLRVFSVASVLGAVVGTRVDYPVVFHRCAADPAAMAFSGRLYVCCSNDDENGDERLRDVFDHLFLASGGGDLERQLGPALPEQLPRGHDEVHVTAACWARCNRADSETATNAGFCLSAILSESVAKPVHPRRAGPEPRPRPLEQLRLGCAYSPRKHQPAGGCVSKDMRTF